MFLSRKSPRRLLGLMVIAAAFLSACSGGSTSPSTGSKSADPAPAPAASASKLKGTEVKLGAIVPSSGPVAEWGKTNTAVLKLVEKEINDKGGVDGKPLKIVIFDSAAKADQAASGVRKLAGDEKVLAIAGPALSSEAEVAFPVANQEKIVVMSQNSSKPGVGAKNRPWAFRDTVDEAVFAQKTVPWFVKQYNVKTVAIVYDAADAVGTSLGKSVLPAEFKKAGVTVLNENDPITFSTTNVDVTAQVTKLKALNPDAVLIGAFYNGASTVLREMKRQGVIKPTLGGSPFVSSAILQAAPEIPVVSAATYFVGLDQAQAPDFTKKAVQALKDAGLPATTEPNMFDANIYETIRMYIDAILKSGVTNDPKDLESDRTKIRDYVAGLKEFQGIGGRVGLNKDGDGDKAFYVIMGQNGKWTVVDKNN
ncbi:MAG TPA: ABC transporter substrate-binding protein [Symbiobacteriaceae bacterium]|nr:ABC transporter substrate-binding protein [Symbiobacteriaceae bacterium]